MADQNQSGGPTSGYNSFLGSETSLSDSPASEPTEAGSSAELTGGNEESTTEAPDTSVDEGAETEQETESLEAESADSDEEDTDYLPDEQAKVFPVEELAKYGKRYGYTLEEIQNDPRLQNALKDKINSDIEIAKQRATAETEETTSEEEATVETTSPEQMAEATAAHMKQLDAMATQFTDPTIAKAFQSELSKAYALTDPEKRDVEATKVFSKFGTNLMMTALPQLLLSPQADGKTMLDRLIEYRYPEFGDMHEKSFYARTWESVRASRPEFSNLPAYGSPDSEFGKLMQQAATKIPNFDKSYAHLPLQQRARAQYELLATVAMGAKPTAAVVKQAEEAGKKKAVEASRKRDLGKALASGQSKKDLASDRSESPMSEGYKLWKERDSNVFGK